MNISFYKQINDEIDYLEELIHKLSSAYDNIPPIKFKEKQPWEELFFRSNYVDDYFDDIDFYERCGKTRWNTSITAKHKNSHIKIRFLKSITNNYTLLRPYYVPERIYNCNISKNIIDECNKNYKYNENIYTGNPGICLMFDAEQIYCKLDCLMELLNSSHNNSSNYEEISQLFGEIKGWIDAYANYRDYPEWLEIIDYAEMIDDSIRDLFVDSRGKHFKKIRKDVSIFSESLCDLIHKYRIGMPINGPDH